MGLLLGRLVPPLQALEEVPAGGLGFSMLWLLSTMTECPPAQLRGTGSGTL